MHCRTRCARVCTAACAMSLRHETGSISSRLFAEQNRDCRISGSASLTFIDSMTATFLDALRPAIRALPAYNSGLSAEYVRAHYHVSEVAKLGSNENPWGASPRVRAALAEALQDVGLYPNPGSDQLRRMLAARLDVAPDRLAFGNGSEDLISVCAHSFLSPGEEMISILPSFGLHAIYSQAIGGHVRLIPSLDYAIDVPGI